MRSLGLALIIQLCLCLSQAQASEAIKKYDFTWLLWEAERAEIDSPSPPTHSQWTPVRMPDSWTLSKRPAPNNMIVWYRFNIPDNLPTQFRSGIFFDRILNNAEVYLNQDYLGNGGKIIAPIARNWNTPNLFKIPSSSWQHSDNTLYVRLLGDDGNGLITPPSFGDYQQLKQTWYKSKKFIRIDLTRVSLMLTALLSLFSLLMWYQTRHKLLLFIGFAGSFWLVTLAYCSGINIPISHPVFLRLAHWSIDACVLFILLFARAKYQLPYQKILTYGLVYLALLALTLGLTPSSTIIFVANGLHLLSQIVILYLVFYTAYAFWRTRSISDFSFCIGLAVIFALFVHDVSLSLSGNLDRWLYDAHIGHLSLPIMFILLCFSLSSMYKDYARQAHALNTSLKDRLKHKKQRLNEKISARQNLLEQQHLSQERELLYNDLHDDLGAKLLSLVYASPDPYKNDLARCTLQDLRDAVSRTSADEILIEALIPDTVEEQCRRCEKLNVDLQSHISGDSNDTCYSGHKAVLFKRLSRELVGVYIHTAQATSLQLHIMVGASGVEIAISGDTPISNLDTASLRARASRINSEIQLIHETEQPSQLVCWIPHETEESLPC